MEDKAMGINKIIFFTIDGKRYKAKILSIDKDTRICQLYIFNTNQTIPINLFEQDTAVQKTPANDTAHDQAKNLVTKIFSPLSGRITKIHVKENMSCPEGEPLVTIESMKMENEIRAPFDLFIKSIPISEGDLVKQNHLLLEIESKKIEKVGSK